MRETTDKILALIERELDHYRKMERQARRRGSEDRADHWKLLVERLETLVARVTKTEVVGGHPG